jgi:acyl-CoA dehydrogenase
MQSLPFFDPDHFELRDRIGAWVQEHWVSFGQQASSVEEEARRLVKLLAESGWLAYVIPKKFGGQREEVQVRDLCILREELAWGSSLVDAMFAMQALGSYPITLYGTDAQRERYLPPIGRGTAIAAFAITEPEAGSDVASLQTRALRRGKEYCLTGVKQFISNAGIADSYVVFASTEPDKRGKGISAFVVEGDDPGLIIKEKTQLMSPHPIGAIEFQECVIPENSILGKEGEGLKVALGTLDVLRCTVGAAAVGLAQRAIGEAIRYSQGRRQFGQPLAEFEAIQFKLADMATALEAARLLVYQGAWLHDSVGNGAKQKSAMAKLFATEAAQRIIDQALQIHGGTGLVSGSIMERLYRDVRALRIYEGTSEIQKLVIARELLKKV